MYGKPGVPTKPEILQARDRILERNPNLRIVGAHLGSMEANFKQIEEHLDRYPNFAIDLSSRMDYLAKQPRPYIIAFITKYRDRLIYGTDNVFSPGDPVQKADKEWEDIYANDWRYLATNDTVSYDNRRAQGLALPESILRKIYHDNAVKWFPGLLSSSH
jgi:predicted TIM-barrel fold metal-dependent hydrolase